MLTTTKKILELQAQLEKLEASTGRKAEVIEENVGGLPSSRKIVALQNAIKQLEGGVAGVNNAPGSEVATALPRVSELRAKLSATEDPRERVRIARQIREIRGNLLEIAAVGATKTDLEAIQKRIAEAKDPRERFTLARIARELREGQRKTKQK